MEKQKIIKINKPIIPETFVLSTDNTKIYRQPIILPIERKLLPNELFLTVNGKTIVALPKQTQVKQDNRTNQQRTQSFREADLKTKLIQLMQAQQKTREVANTLIERTMPSYWVEKATGEELTPAAKLAADVAVPWAVGKGALTISKGANYLARMDMTRYGYKPTTKYYFAPGYTGMNGVPILQSNDVTNNLLKWLGYKNPEKVNPLFPITEEKNLPIKILRMMELWRKNGVDLSKVTLNDIEKAYLLRQLEILSTAPSRYTLIDPLGGNSYEGHDFLNGEVIGSSTMGVHKSGNIRMSTIGNMTESPEKGISATVHGVQERGLNSAILLAHSNKMKGAVSGEEYLSAPKQYHVVLKFKDREVLGRDGEHSNTNMVTEYKKRNNIPDDYSETMATSMLDLAKAGETQRKTLWNAPYWLLKSPTFHVPTKSTIFNPQIIDKFGKMHIDWNNPDVYRTIIPTTLGGTFVGKTFGNINNSL